MKEVVLQDPLFRARRLMAAASHQRDESATKKDLWIFRKGQADRLFKKFKSSKKVTTHSMQWQQHSPSGTFRLSCNNNNQHLRFPS